MSAERAPRPARSGRAASRACVRLLFLLAALILPQGCTSFTRGAEPDDRDEHGRSVEERLADDHIASQVELAIARDQALSGARVAASAVRGVVALEGTVASDAERRHALGRARLVEGVAGVVDRLTIARE